MSYISNKDLETTILSLANENSDGDSEEEVFTDALDDFDSDRPGKSVKSALIIILWTQLVS